MTTGNRPTTNMVLPKIKAYLQTPGNQCGGNCHIVLDDKNIKDSHIEYCLEICKEKGDVLGEEIMLDMLQMTKTQRGKVVK